MTKNKSYVEHVLKAVRQHKHKQYVERHMIYCDEIRRKGVKESNDVIICKALQHYLQTLEHDEHVKI